MKSFLGKKSSKTLFIMNNNDSQIDYFVFYVFLVQENWQYIGLYCFQRLANLSLNLKYYFSSGKITLQAFQTSFILIFLKSIVKSIKNQALFLDA